MREREVVSEDTAAVPCEVAVELLKTEPQRLLKAGDGAGRGRRFAIELRVDAAGASAVQDVLVEIGHAVKTPDGSSVFPLAWVPAAHDKLLPSCHGMIEVGDDGDEGTRVRIRAAYVPPLGRIGAFGDGLIGHRLARRSVEALVARVADRLVAEWRERREPATVRPAPYPESFI